MPPSTLILRADASIAMGTGHLMRCLALAQAWQDHGGECIFAMAESTASAEERIRRENFEVITLTESPGYPAGRGADWSNSRGHVRPAGSCWMVTSSTLSISAS